MTLYDGIIVDELYSIDVVGMIVDILLALLVVDGITFIEVVDSVYDTVSDSAKINMTK